MGYHEGLAAQDWIGVLICCETEVKMQIQPYRNNDNELVWMLDKKMRLLTFKIQPPLIAV